MDRIFQYQGTKFVWHDAKALENERKHGIRFDDAATVFGDPLLCIRNASRHHERRDAAIGFDSLGRLLTVIHIEVNGKFIRIVSAWRASAAEEAFYDR